jgi:hypothetical protein
MNRRSVLGVGLTVAAMMMTGCATYNPIPEGYTGPRATIKESVQVYSNSKADFFYVDAVDGHEIDNSRINTIQRNSGRGMNMTPYLVEREVPARTCTLRLVGRTEYAAPILAMTNPVYQVKGDIQFTPQAGRTYIVNGKLSDTYSAVWIEEEGAGVVADTSIEVKGSAKLGFFEK